MIKVFVKKFLILILSVIVIVNLCEFILQNETEYYIERNDTSGNAESYIDLTLTNREKAPIMQVNKTDVENQFKWATTTKTSKDSNGDALMLNMTYEDAIILKQERLIEEELQNGTLTNNTKDLQMINGGKPIRNIIFTTWRSGSTFLGEALNSYPGTFYHFEPLFSLDRGQIKPGNMTDEALRVIKNLFQCDYSELQDYVDNGKKNLQLHMSNSRLWPNCELDRKLCEDPNFLSEICKRFPFQLIKIVRLRLKYAEELIQDETLDVRVVFLIRDPRGVIHSRKRMKWCLYLHNDCSNPARLCSDMVDDYHSAVELLRKYPDKIMILRYEDFSLNPYSGIKKVLQFFRLEYQPQVKDFIKFHTSNNEGGAHSTFRDSKSTPFNWIKDFVKQEKELNNVQTACKKAMDLWGYAELDVKINSSFIPPTGVLLEPPWKEMIVPQDNQKESN